MFAWTVLQQMHKRLSKRSLDWVAELAWEQLSSFSGTLEASFFTEPQLWQWAEAYVDTLIKHFEKKAAEQEIEGSGLLCTTMRRYTRLSNGFSRKLRNHAAATALNYFAYNFIKIHRTLRTSPAMGCWCHRSALGCE